MMNRIPLAIVIATALSGLCVSSDTLGQESVASRIEKLEQEMAALKRQLAAEQQADEEAATKAARVELDKSGLKVASVDGSYSLRIRGYLQLDGKSFISDDADLAADSYLIRRARPIFEGTAGNFGFRVMPDFGGTSTQLFDAYAEYKPSSRFNLRAGKFKTPVGLDRLRSATDLAFVERSLPTNLVPIRDIGVMAYGEPLPGFTWEAGVFNGTEDTGNATGDVDDEKEFSARIFSHPFAQTDSALKGLGLGLAGSWGEKEGDLLNRQVGDYRSPSLERVFRYRTSAFADGDHWRIAPQGYYFLGPFGALAEYTISSQEIRNGADRAQIENSAWEAQFSYVLTGESASYRGWPVPANPFNPMDGDWGAWEVAARYGVLTVDDAAFPVFADPAVAVREESNFGLAVHAYLNENIRASMDYQNTGFKGGAPEDSDRETEQVLLARLNYKF